MKRAKKAVVVTCILVVSFASNGCKSKEESSADSKQAAQAQKPELPVKASGPMVIEKFGPNHVKAGQVFNKQSGGDAAVWMRAKNVVRSAVIVINGTQLKTDLAPDFACAIVPANLYEKKGVYLVHLLDTQSGAKSNEVEFVVE